MAFHLLKMIRLSEEIKLVWKKVQRHQQDESLKSLKKQIQFISLNCHAELAILKTAKDSSLSKTLYIGVSKRPCYCCSLFFKAVEENKSTPFRISIVRLTASCMAGGEELSTVSIRSSTRSGQKW